MGDLEAGCCPICKVLWQLTAVTICGARTGSSIGVEWGAHRTGVSRSELSLVVTLTSGSSATSESERRQLEGGNRASLPPDPSMCEEISPTTVSFLSKGAKAPIRRLVIRRNRKYPGAFKMASNRVEAAINNQFITEWI